MGTIREAKVAGTFYPSDKEELKSQINELVNSSVSEEKFDDIFGLVVPHAGYIYSGSTAAAVYKLLVNKNFETVIIISPSHREYFPGISIYSGEAYETPLGYSFVDEKKKKVLLSEAKYIFEGEEGHRAEHALEVQLPFLQTVLDDFTILPIVMGDQSQKYINELSKKISEIYDDKTLVIASSDLSHFYTRMQASVLDNRVVDKINNFDIDGFQNDIEFRKSEACGAGGIITMLNSAKKMNYNKSKVINYTDSGNVTGDTREVVGYLSAVVYR